MSEIQERKGTALQLNFHLLDGNSYKQNVFSLGCWQPRPTCQEVLMTISRFLVRVLKTHNLFGNFTFLLEAVREAILCTFNYKAILNVESSFQVYKIRGDFEKYLQSL